MHQIIDKIIRNSSHHFPRVYQNGRLSDRREDWYLILDWFDQGLITLDVFGKELRACFRQKLQALSS